MHTFKYVIIFCGLKLFKSTMVGSCIKIKAYTRVEFFIGVKQGHRYCIRDVIIITELDNRNLFSPVIPHVITEPS